MKENSLIILGMGNKLLGDDGVGVLIAEKLKEILKHDNSITIDETNWGGFRVIDLLSGFEKAIIIDAVKTGGKQPGFIHKFKYTDLIHSVRMVSFHDINFATAVEFAKKLEIPMPADITVYAVEVEETETITEELTPNVEKSIDDCVRRIIQNLDLKINIDEPDLITV